MSNAAEDGDHQTIVILAVVVAVQKDLRHVRLGTRRIHGGSKYIMIVGESLDQAQAVGKHEDRKPCALWFVVDELQQLPPGDRLFVGLGVHQIQEQHIERTALRATRNVHKSIWRHGRQLRRGKVRLQIVRAEGKNLLGPAVLGNRKIVLAQPWDGLAVRVDYRHIDDDTADGSLDR